MPSDPLRVAFPKSMSTPVLESENSIERPVRMRESLEKFKQAETERARKREAQDRLRNRLNLVGNAIFYSFVIMFGVFWVWQFLDRSVPGTYEVRLVNNEVHAGDPLKFTVTPYRYRLCQGRAKFDAFDGEGSVKTLQTDWAYPAGGEGADLAFQRQITIPHDAVPGASRLRIQREYRCPLNIVQLVWPITDTTPDLRFTVLPPK